MVIYVKGETDVREGRSDGDLWQKRGGIVNQYVNIVDAGFNMEFGDMNQIESFVIGNGDGGR